MDTKQKIHNAALALFACHGYEAVSIRDICGQVGIKESTVYYHYKSKRDIYDELLLEVQAHMEAMRTRFLARFEGLETVTEDAFAAVGVHYLHTYFQAEPTRSFISMLSIERLRDAQAERLYQSLAFEAPLAHQRAVFMAMSERGIFTPDDAALLALEYQYAVFGAYMSGADDETLAALIRRIYRRGKPNEGI